MKASWVVIMSPSSESLKGTQHLDAPIHNQNSSYLFVSSSRTDLDSY